MPTTNSSRRFYRNYKDLGSQTSLLIPGDPANPGVFPVQFFDNAAPFNKSRATWTSATGITYPELQTVSNLRYSYDANGIGNGWVLENAPQNFAIRGSTFAASGWTATNCTAVLNEVGPDDLLNSAANLTATAGNATFLQTRAIGIPVGNRYFSIWVKRIFGTGGVNLTADNVTNTVITTRLSTTEWRRFVILVNTATVSATYGIKLTQSGDAVAIHGPGLHVGWPASTSLATTTTLAAVNEYVEAYVPGTVGTQLAPGATVVARIKTGTREAGFYGTSAWQYSTESVGSVGMSTSEGETGLRMDWSTDSSDVAINAFDYIGAGFDETRSASISLINTSMVVAIAHKDGQVRMASNLTDSITINDSNYLFNRDSQGVLLSVALNKGSCYIEYLAGWSYYIDDVSSLVANYR